MVARSLSAVAAAALLASVAHAAPPANFPDWGPPEPAAELNTAADEWSPWISADGLTILFAREPTGLPSQRLADLRMATRPNRESPFEASSPISELNTPDSDELMPSMTADGLEIFFFRQGATAQLMTARRETTADPFDAPTALAVTYTDVTSVTLLRYPHVAPDGLTLYLSDRPTAQAGSTIDVFASTRVSRQASFATAFQVPGFQSLAQDETSFWLSADRLTAWTSVRPTTSSTTSLAVSRRASTGAQFPAPTVLGELSAAGFSASPAVTADEKEIYFFSNRAGGQGGLDIWRAGEAQWSLWTVR